MPPSENKQEMKGTIKGGYTAEKVDPSVDHKEVMLTAMCVIKYLQTITFFFTNF